MCRAMCCVVQTAAEFLFVKSRPLDEMPFLSEQGAVEGMLVESQLNARERLG